MGKGAAIHKTLHQQIVEQCWIDGFQCKSKRFRIFLHPRYVILSKDSENLETSLCAKDTARNQRWKLMIFKPSGSSALKSGITLSWAQEHFQRSLSVNTVHRVIHKCRSKLYHAKKKPYVNISQRCHHLLMDATASGLKRGDTENVQNHFKCIFHLFIFLIDDSCLTGVTNLMAFLCSSSPLLWLTGAGLDCFIEHFKQRPSAETIFASHVEHATSHFTD